MLRVSPVVTTVLTISSPYVVSNSVFVNTDSPKVNKKEYAYSINLVNNTIADVYVSINNDGGTLAMGNRLSFENLSGDGYSLKFKQPFTLFFTYEDEFYFADYDDIGYHGFARSLKELRDDFEEHLIVDWQMYVDCSEQELSEDAIELKYKLLELLVEI